MTILIAWVFKVCRKLVCFLKSGMKTTREKTAWWKSVKGRNPILIGIFSLFFYFFVNEKLEIKRDWNVFVYGTCREKEREREGERGKKVINECGSKIHYTSLFLIQREKESRRGRGVWERTKEKEKKTGLAILWEEEKRLNEERGKGEAHRKFSIEKKITPCYSAQIDGKILHRDIN